MCKKALKIIAVIVTLILFLVATPILTTYIFVINPINEKLDDIDIEATQIISTLQSEPELDVELLYEDTTKRTYEIWGKGTHFYLEEYNEDLGEWKMQSDVRCLFHKKIVTSNSTIHYKYGDSFEIRYLTIYRTLWLQIDCYLFRFTCDNLSVGKQLRDDVLLVLDFLESQ